MDTTSADGFPKLEDLENRQFDDDDSADIPPSDIVAYNELRSCADVFRMHKQGSLITDPEFQRDVVWPAAAQTRFVDSLFKQLPIPSMCFALDPRQHKWVVIDGLQRVSTITRFLEGGDWKLAHLDDVDPKIRGKSVAALKLDGENPGSIYNRVENLTIPITVLRCDFGKRTHLEYLFTIFHRLNTGGMKLNNQEIRNCIYAGPLNQLLRRLDKVGSWRKLNRMAKSKNYRLRKQEVILRFFALADRFESYSGSLSKFLNDYMFANRDPTTEFLDSKESVFMETVDCLNHRAMGGAPPKKVPTAVMEAALVGISRNIGNEALKNEQRAKSMFDSLLEDPLFEDGALREGLSKKPRVIARLNRAVQIFSEN